MLLFSPGVFRSVFFLFFLGWVILGPKKDEFYIGIALPRSPSHTLSLSLPFRSLRARSRKLIFTFGDCQKDGNRKIIIKRTAQEFSLVPLFAASVYFTDITLFCTFSPFIFCVFAGKRVYVDFFFRFWGNKKFLLRFFLSFSFSLRTPFSYRLVRFSPLPRGSHTLADSHTQTRTHTHKHIRTGQTTKILSLSLIFVSFRFWLWFLLLQRRTGFCFYYLYFSTCFCTSHRSVSRIGWFVSCSWQFKILIITAIIFNFYLVEFGAPLFCTQPPSTVSLLLPRTPLEPGRKNRAQNRFVKIIRKFVSINIGFFPGDFNGYRCALSIIFLTDHANTHAARIAVEKAITKIVGERTRDGKCSITGR